MASSRLSNTLVLTFFLLVESIGQAKPRESADPYDAARDAEARLDYKAVVANATKALAQANSYERMVVLYRLLGTAQGVLGKSDEAVDAFTKLLAIDPEHRLPKGTSPKITTPFKEAGGFWVDRPGGLQLVPTVPREIVAAKDLVIPVKLDDPLSMTANVRLSYRIQTGAEFTKVEVPAAAALSFTVAADKIPALENDYAMELFVTALSASGSELRLAGDATKPLSIVVRVPKGSEPVVLKPAPGPLVDNEPPPKKNAIVKKWWLWTAIGGVIVVGAALGGGLGYYYSRDTSHVDVNVTSRVGP